MKSCFKHDKLRLDILWLRDEILETQPICPNLT